MRNAPAQPERGKFRRTHLAETLTGIAICGTSALITSLLTDAHSWKVSVPLVFTVIPLLVSVVLGAQAGIFGTLLAALVFSFFLFPPTGSLHVANTDARLNLAWMLLLGISFSALLAPSPMGLRRR